MIPMLDRGKELFLPDEFGHPNSLFRDFAPAIAPNLYASFSGGFGISLRTPVVEALSRDRDLRGSDFTQNY